MRRLVAPILPSLTSVMMRSPANIPATVTVSCDIPATVTNYNQLLLSCFRHCFSVFKFLFSLLMIMTQCLTRPLSQVPLECVQQLPTRIRPLVMRVPTHATRESVRAVSVRR